MTDYNQRLTAVSRQIGGLKTASALTRQKLDRTEIKINAVLVFLGVYVVATAAANLLL